MAQLIVCPKCKKGLRTNGPIPGGKKIKCPACQQLFVTDDDPDAVAVQARAPTPIVSKASPSIKASGPRPQAKRSVVEEVLDAEEVDEDRPRKRRREEIDDDDIDRRNRRHKKKKSGSGMGLILSLVGAGVALVIFMITGFVWPGFFHSGGGGGAPAAAGGPIAGAAAPAGGGRAGEPNPLAFIPADANLVVGVNFLKMRAMPGFDQGFNQGVQQGWNAAQQNLGQFGAPLPQEIIDLFTSAETVIVAMAVDRSELQAGVVVTDKPYDAERIKAKLGQPTMVQGHAIYTLRSNNAGNQQFGNPPVGNPQANAQQLHVAMPTPRTVVVSQLPTARFAQLLVGATQVRMNQDFAGQVASVQGSMFWGVLQLDQGLKQKMQPTLQNLPPDTSPEVRNLATVILRSKALTISVNLFDQNMKVQAGIACNDANDAAQVKNTLQSLWSLHGKQFSDLMGAMGGPQMGKLFADIGQTVAFEQRETVASASLQLNLNAIQQFANQQQQGFMPFNPGFNPPPVGIPQKKGPPVFPKKGR